MRLHALGFGHADIQKRLPLDIIRLEGNKEKGRMRGFKQGVLAAAALTLTPAVFGGTLTLNHGNALYVDTTGATPTSTTFGGGGSNTTDVFRPEGGTTTYHLYESGWSWRINGVDTREFAFSSAGAVEAGNGTALGTRTWASLASGAFSAVQTIALTDGGVAGQAIAVHTMTVTNLGGSPLDISLFNYTDFDVSATAGGDSGVWLDQPNDIMKITDGANFAEYRGVDADAYQVTAFATLRGLLTNTVINNLNNTGLPFGPGDFTGGFQWNRVIAAGDSASVVAIYAINQSVPAPGALALLGLAGLVGTRRRR
jgi:hypothetical protein